MCKVNYEEQWLSTVLGLLATNPEVEMALFAAYINEGLCYEFFCETMPPEVFCVLRSGINSNINFRKALVHSGIVQKGVQRYIGASFDDFDMWFHFLDGTVTILTDPELIKFLPIQDRNLACSLLALWRNQQLNEDTWDSYLHKVGILY